jgi:hypothetical protein
MSTWEKNLPARIYNVEALDAKMRKEIKGFTGISTGGNRIWACFEPWVLDTPELAEQVAKICEKHEPEDLTPSQKLAIAEASKKIVTGEE